MNTDIAVVSANIEAIATGAAPATCLRITIRLKTEVERAKNVFFVLDVSGSMSGSRLATAKSGITSLFESLYQQQQDRFIITYDDKIQMSKRLPDDKQVAIKLINSIHTGGSTGFRVVFNELATILRGVKTPTVIVFFTDGCDTVATSPAQIRDALNQLSLCLAGSAVECHTIGIGADHDNALLTSLTRMGPVQGTFQYVTSDVYGESAAVPLSTAIDNLKGALMGDLISATITIGDNRQALNLEEAQDESGKYYTATCFTNQQLGEHVTLVVRSDRDHVIKVPVTIVEADAVTLIDCRISLLEQKVVMLAGRLNKVDVARDILLAIDAELDAIIGQIWKLKDRSARKTQAPRCQELKGTIAQLNSTLAAAAVRGLDNDRLATLNALAYKGVTKKSLQKKLDQRSTANVELFNKLDSQIDDVVKSIDFDILHDDGKIVCDLSGSTWVEALRGGDCICVALSVSRPQSAIADPSQVVIKDIHPMYLSADNFLDAVEFAVGQKGDAAHGGFSKAADGSLLLGNDGKPVSGVLPLYLNAAHWSVARHKMKPIMGWTATLDVLGYSHAQIRTIPFAVLHVAMVRKLTLGTHYASEQYELILETCQQIWKDASAGPLTGGQTRWTDEVITLCRTYVADPSVRTVDRIPKNKVFMAQIWTAITLGLVNYTLEYWEMFCRYMYEEGLRRNLPSSITDATPEEIRAIIHNALNVDPIYWEPRVQRLDRDLQSNKTMDIDGGDRFTAKFRSLLNTSGNNIVNLSNVQTVKSEPVKDEFPDVEADIHVKYGEFLARVKVTLYEDQKTRTTMASIMPFLGVSANVLDLDHQTRAAIWIQNMNGRTNAMRRESIAKGAHVDVFGDNVRAVIVNEIIRDVADTYRAKVAEVTDRHMNDKSNGTCATFGRTRNLHQAAGILIGVKFGTDFSYYIRELQAHECPLALEKINMLMTGRYMGVKLITGMPDGGGDWYPSRRNVNRFKRANPNAYAANRAR